MWVSSIGKRVVANNELNMLMLFVFFLIVLTMCNNARLELVMCHIAVWVINMHLMASWQVNNMLTIVTCSYLITMK